MLSPPLQEMSQALSRLVMEQELESEMVWVLLELEVVEVFVVSTQQEKVEVQEKLQELF